MSVLICQLSMVFKGSECKRERYLHTKYVCQYSTIQVDTGGDGV